MTPQAWIFLATNIASAYIWYQLGRNKPLDKKERRQLIEYVVKDQVQMFAKCYYPGDQHGEAKVMQMIAMQSAKDLVEIMGKL